MKVKAVQDVSKLPSEVHGSRNVGWWGALGGEVIEGFVLLILVFSWFYLRHLAPHWPPLHTPVPSLGIPTLNLLVLTLSLVPAWWAYRSARRQDRFQTILGLAGHAVLGLLFLVLRYFEMRALNVRWDTNAYGSLGWAILFSHGYLALFDIFDTLGLLLLFLRLEPLEKHYIATTENSFFWYFVAATWVPLYLIVFLGPR